MSGGSRETVQADQPGPPHSSRPRAGGTPKDPRSASSAQPSLTTPLPTITTFNTNSLCMHALEVQGRRRRTRKLNYVSRLSHADILCLQEVQLGAKDTMGLDIYFPQHTIFYNNLRLGRAGTATLVRRRYAKDWDIAPLDIGEAARGWIQVLLFTPRGSGAHARRQFILVNAYLPSGGDVKRRLDLIGRIRELGRSNLLFLVGDLNMIDCVEDASSGDASSILLQGAHRRYWDRLLADTKLREVHQPSHTHFFLHGDASLTRSSRIDRVYTNIPDGILLFANPVAHTPYAGPSPLVMDGQGQRAAHFRRLHVSDHVPVTLSFDVASQKVKRRFNAPSWLGHHQGTAESIKDLWVGFDPDSGESPFQALQDWKAAVRHVVKAYFKGSKATQDAHRNAVQRLSAATSLLHACSRVRQDQDRIASLLRRHCFLTEHCRLEGDRYSEEGLVTFIDDLLACSLRDCATGHQKPTDEEGLELPESYIPGAQRRRDDPITRIKSRLPNARARLTSLRADACQPLTSDPGQMGDITVDHYTKVWAPVPGGTPWNETQALLNQVNAQIPVSLQPQLPCADDFMDVINGSNDSCAGPDGIPFSFYRAYSLIDGSLAEVLAAICAQLGAGVLPPEGYNHARFFLIPKKGGGLIHDTRGISVTNADNRLVATAMKQAIEPALQAVIGDTQQGFVSGRQGDRHIRELTRDFYSRMDKKQQRFVLMVDMARAFDSVTHSFIHSCLQAMNFAGWFCRAVAGLLHQVVVFPVLAVITNHKVEIHKGVKQGCPLSPLLFVICFEFLLRALGAEPRLSCFAFADDLALAVSSISVLLRALGLILAFSKVSGLWMNRVKTVIVTTRPPSAGARRRLDEAGWGAVKFADSAKYLGLLFGRNVTTVDIFREAKTKFFKRYRLFSGVIASSSLNDRVLIFNTFLLPLFYYLARYAVIPWGEVVVPVRQLCHRKCVAFHGGFAYPHLVAPRHVGVGPFTPLKDLWSVNMVLLGSDFPMEDSHQAPTPKLDRWHWVSQYGGLDGTVDPAAHAAYAAFVFLESYTPRAGGLIDLSDLPVVDKGARRRSWIYNRLADRGYWLPRVSPRRKTSLAVKLHKFVGSPAPCLQLSAHARAHAITARKRVTPSQWNVQLRLIMNVLPFAERRFKAGLLDETLPCYFCGGAEDSRAHVFRCAVICRAREEVGRRARCRLPDGLEFTALTHPPPAWS